VPSITSPGVIGFPRETTPGDRRTLLTPIVARLFTSAGFIVLAEPGVAVGIGYPDQALVREGVRFASADAVWSSPLILRYKSGNPDELRRLAPGHSIAALFHAEGDPHLLNALVQSRVTAYSYEFLTEYNRFPLASAGGQIAGIQAVHYGAQALQHPAGRGVLLGGVPGTDPAQVLVIGAGNVGAAAARTAAALGARVGVLTGTEAGAESYRGRAPRGSCVAINTPPVLARLLPQSDLVIGAILISTFDTPPMIGKTELAGMRPGSVIVDATCGYGAGYLPTAGPVQTSGMPPHIVNGVLHVKLDALPSLVPRTASHAYTDAAAPYLLRLVRHVLTGTADPAIASACIARDGALVHHVCQQHAAFHNLGVLA
jgi:alanine dehydrogenase